MSKALDKLSRLRKSLAAKEEQLARFSEKIQKDRLCEKSLKDEISALKSEISAEEMRRLFETMSNKGIKVTDIEEAIAAGIFEKNDTDIPSGNSGNSATNSTENSDNNTELSDMSHTDIRSDETKEEVNL